MGRQIKIPFTKAHISRSTHGTIWIDWLSRVSCLLSSVAVRLSAVVTASERRDLNRDRYRIGVSVVPVCSN